jgi:hypothetical protein
MLLAQCNRICPFSGLVRGVKWFETDVSGLFVGLIFKGQALPQKGNSLTLEDGTNRYSRNVGFKPPYVA